MPSADVSDADGPIRCSGFLFGRRLDFRSDPFLVFVIVLVCVYQIKSFVLVGYLFLVTVDHYRFVSDEHVNSRVPQWLHLRCSKFPHSSVDHPQLYCAWRVFVHSIENCNKTHILLNFLTSGGHALGSTKASKVKSIWFWSRGHVH